MPLDKLTCGRLLWPNLLPVWSSIYRLFKGCRPCHGENSKRTSWSIEALCRWCNDSMTFLDIVAALVTICDNVMWEAVGGHGVPQGGAPAKILLLPQRSSYPYRPPGSCTIGIGLGEISWDGADYGGGTRGLFPTSTLHPVSNAGARVTVPR